MPEYFLEKLRTIFRGRNNEEIYDVDNELWTLKKIVRRFIWHDRIHAKAIARIQEKQKALGLIEGYEDPFCFAQLKPVTPTNRRNLHQSSL
jgi:hypothetical protein